MTNIHEDWRCKKCKCSNPDMVVVCRNCGVARSSGSVVGCLAAIVLVGAVVAGAAYSINDNKKKDDKKQSMPQRGIMHEEKKEDEE